MLYKHIEVYIFLLIYIISIVILFFSIDVSNKIVQIINKLWNSNFVRVYINIIYLTVIFCLVLISPLDAVEINPRFELDTGLRFSLSSVDSSTHTYYKPYIISGCRTDYFGIFGGYVHYFDYRIIDSSFNEESIDLNKINIDLEAYPTERFYTGFEFSYYFGESSYKGTDYMAEAGYDFDKVSLYGEFSYSNWEYVMSGITLGNTAYDIYGEISYYIYDDLNINISYNHLYSSSHELDYENRMNIFRPGVMKGFKDIVYIMGGVGLGWSSSDYFIASMDIGITVYAWKYLRITAFYLLYYNHDLLQYSQNTIDSILGISQDTSYFSHRFSMSASFYYH